MIFQSLSSPFFTSLSSLLLSFLLFHLMLPWGPVSVCSHIATGCQAAITVTSSLPTSPLGQSGAGDAGSSHTHTHKRPHTQTHTQTHAHTQTHTHTRTHTQMHNHAIRHTQYHTYIHTPTHTHKLGSLMTALALIGCDLISSRQGRTQTEPLRTLCLHSGAWVENFRSHTHTETNPHTHTHEHANARRHEHINTHRQRTTYRDTHRYTHTHKQTNSLAFTALLQAIYV